MKTLRTMLCLGILSILLASNQTAMASNAAPQEKVQEMLQQRAAARHEAFQALGEKMGPRFAKKLAKAEKFIAKREAQGKSIDLNDPVDKWMWFWIFGWAAAVVLYIVGFAITPLWYLGWLCGLAGTVCLVIWILKKTGNM